MMKYCVYFLCLSCLPFVIGTEKLLRVGNPDDTAKIERPCSVYDLNCIRKFFSEHAHCTKVFGPAPDPYVRPQLSLFFPWINLTMVVLDENVQGLNGRIEEFYINRDTDNLVIAVEFRNLRLSSNNTYFQFHRRAKEPVVTTAEASIVYQSIVVTAIIPKIDDLQLDYAECTTFSNDANPPLTVGESAYNSDDPQVQRTVALFQSNLPLDIQETYLTDSAFFVTMFIQYNICDFGVLVP